jgi:long-subunit acyl-CoA synthetase (AMP-forming)
MRMRRLPDSGLRTGKRTPCGYILGNSGARFLVCEDDVQREKLEPARSESEVLEQVALIDVTRDSRSLSLEDVRQRGRAQLGEAPEVVERQGPRLSGTTR